MPIARNPAICGGSPTLEGRRIMVSDLVCRIKGDGVDVTQEDLKLTFDVIEEAVTYCAALKCIQEYETLPLCKHCTLYGLSPDFLKASGLLESKRPTTIPRHEDSENSHMWLLALDMQRNIREHLRRTRDQNGY
ncbi:MAG: DUF433 domain-containing protein [Candidatus Methylacidiphilales bacterium]